MFAVNGQNPWATPQSSAASPSSNPAQSSYGQDLVANNPAQGGVYSGGFGYGADSQPLTTPTAAQYAAANAGGPMGPFPDSSGPLNTPTAAQYAAANANGPMGPFQSGGPSGGSSPFANPTFENYGGYNPAQYATLATANNLAQQLGGNVMQTRMAPGSPFAVPNQNSIYLGGNDPLNAGLLAQRYAKYDRATADAMTRDEMRMMNPNAGPSYGSDTSIFQAMPGGLQNLGNGNAFTSQIGRNYAPGAAGLGTAGQSGNSGGFQNFQSGGFPGFGGFPQQGVHSVPQNGGMGGGYNPFQGFVGGLGRSSNFMRANPFGSSFTGYRARQPQLGGGMYSALRGNPFLYGALGAGAGGGMSYAMGGPSGGFDAAGNYLGR